MSKKRARPPTEDTCVHLISRTVDGDFKFKQHKDKVLVRDLIKKTARFCAVVLKDYTILDNHFHIVSNIPPRPEVIPLETVLLRIEEFYEGKALDTILQKWDQIEKLGGESALEDFADTFRRRMYDMAEFMKSLKQLVTTRYNKSHHRRGTLWESRYKSILVQGNPNALALQTVSAYVSLNPVRSGLVDDPRRYPFSAYGEATAGDKAAREGLMSVMPVQGDGTWEAFDAAYKQLLYESEEHKRGPEAAERLGKAMGVKHRPTKQVANATNAPAAQKQQPASRLLPRGKASRTFTQGELLRKSVRLFSDGLAFGDRDFVNAVFHANRQLFGPNRKVGARPISICPEWQGRLYAARDLRRSPVAEPTV